MNTVMNASVILGLTAMIANAGSRTANNTNTAANPPACEWQVAKAAQDTVWTNILEGGPIKAIVSAGARSRPYRDIVCANPQVDWSKFGHIEVESIGIAASNLKKPLSESQADLLKTALATALSKQFREADHSGCTLKIRATVTEVRRTQPLLNVATLAAIQTPVSFGGATAHFELIDGAHGTKVADVTLRGSGRLYEILPSINTLGDSKKVLGRVSRQLSKEIQMLRQNSAPAAVQVASNVER
ncbi:MAG: DUF3313 family protein [Acidobacteriaceae bacterium]|nr:DUF3313 family protein [Acidobacteriaceae bacterium]